MTAKRVKTVLLSGLGLIVLVAFLLWFFDVLDVANESYRNPIECNDGWTIEFDGEILPDQSFTEYTIPRQIRRGDEIILKNTLPEKLPESATMRLLTYLSTVRVFVGGEEIYSFGVEAAADGGMVGSGYQFVLLPIESDGEKIEIRIAANENGAMTNIPPMVILPSEYAYEEFFDSNILVAFCCIFLFVFGVILTLVGTIAFARRQTLAPLVHIGFFSLLIGYWAMCNTKIFQLYSLDLTLNTVTEYLALYFAMCPLLLLLIVLRRQSAVRWKQILLWVQFAVLLLFSTTATILHFSEILHLPQTLAYFHALAVIEAGGMLVAGLHFGETRTVPARILNLALFEILIVGVLDILRFNIQKYLLPDATILDHSVLPFGVLIFILLLIISYVVQMYGSIIDAAEKETLTRLAYQDTLTGLYNRSMSEKLFAECDASDEEYALVNLDLNGLKKVNDSFGHAQGDQLIQDFAEILRKAFTGVGMIARMGGDEFAVVVRGKEIESIDRALTRLVQEEEKLSWLRDYEISSSFGVAYRKEKRGASAEQLYRLADQRMYEMKIRTKKQRVD